MHASYVQGSHLGSKLNLPNSWQRVSGNCLFAALSMRRAINPQRLGLPKRSPSLNRMLEQWVEEHGGSKPIHRYTSSRGQNHACWTSSMQAASSLGILGPLIV
jgi:hypothetical protein